MSRADAGKLFKQLARQVEALKERHKEYRKGRYRSVLYRMGGTVESYKRANWR